jgi:hypothetical protein
VAASSSGDMTGSKKRTADGGGRWPGPLKPEKRVYEPGTPRGPETWGKCDQSSSKQDEAGGEESEQDEAGGEAEQDEAGDEADYGGSASD